MKLLLLSLLALSQGLAACAGHQVTDAGDVRPLTDLANIAPIPDPSPDRHFSRLTEDDFREVAEDYPDIEANDCIIDALCMKLVQRPEQFDMLVAPNLYGDIISDLCAGLVGGLGFAPSANIGDKTRIYEAVHGSAPDIAGQDKANPSAILMAFAMMLNDLGETDKASKLNAAILAQVEEGKVVTADIGGTAGTKEFTQAVIARL